MEAKDGGRASARIDESSSSATAHTPDHIPVLAKLVAELQVPLSLGVLGAADAPLRKLRDDLALHGWVKAVEVEKALRAAMRTDGHTVGNGGVSGVPSSSSRDQRDPRIDPRPGDTLRAADGQDREVERVQSWGSYANVYWKRPGGKVRHQPIWLPYWWKWSKKTVVIKRGV